MQYKYLNRYWLFHLLLFLVISISGVTAQESPGSSQGDTDAQVVEYDAEFFSRYRPNTALDMVRQLPGFTIDDGTDNRGFASSVGNILINDRRISAKQDLPSDTLARIPASQVERIQLVRGQLGGIDLQGQSVVANIFLRKEDNSAIRWETYLEHNNTAGIKPAGSISLSDTWKGIDFNTGVDIERNTSGYYGSEAVFDGTGTLISEGPESSTEDGYQLNGVSLNASSLLGETFTHLNTKYFGSESDYERPSSAILQSNGTIDDELIKENRIIRRFELGLDAEQKFYNELTGKFIFLLSNGKLESLTSRNNSNSVSGQTLLRIADTNTTEKERIARLEFDWLGLANHSLQANLEGAYNVLDRNLMQTDDRGAGPLPVNVPGANSRVKELRGDFLLLDTWSLGRFELDYGLGLELSSVTQTGDANQKRNFLFLKPQTTLSYSPSGDDQTRFHLIREVSQLNLTDFVSSTVFEDDDLALGNPDIKPEKTWVAEISHEKRFDKIGVIKLTAFHHWISDVLDLLPFTPDFEVPGNIGDGRRWGMEFESTAPLDWTGLSGAKLELTLRWQDSTVIDPVTGNNRVLSGEGGQNAYRTLTNRNKNNRYFVSVNFRQDFEAARVAWGWTVAERDQRSLFKVNEFDVFKEDIAVDAFIETTRWFGVKIRLDAQNISDDASERVRTRFRGERGLSPIDSSVANDRFNGRRLVLSLSGSF
jgi:hypothetical protein